MNANRLIEEWRKQGRITENIFCRKNLPPRLRPHPLPLFLAEHAEETEQRDIGKAWTERLSRRESSRRAFWV